MTVSSVPGWLTSSSEFCPYLWGIRRVLVFLLILAVAPPLLTDSLLLARVARLPRGILLLLVRVVCLVGITGVISLEIREECGKYNQRTRAKGRF